MKRIITLFIIIQLCFSSVQISAFCIDEDNIQWHRYGIAQKSGYWQFYIYGLASFENSDGFYGVFNKEKEWVVPCEYDAVFLDMLPSESRGEYIVVKKTGLQGCFDKKGNLVLPIVYSSIKYFKNDMFVVSKRGKYGLVNSKNELVMPLKYDNFKVTIDGFLIAEKDNKQGLIDEKEVITIPFVYDEIIDVKNGYLKVKSNDKFGILNNQNNLLIPLEYDELEFSGKNLLSAKKDGKFGLINIKNNKLTGFEFDSRIYFNKNIYAAVRKEDKEGAIDRNGKAIIPCEYKFLSNCGNYFFATKNGKQGVIDKNNNEVIPIMYDDIYTNSHLLTKTSLNDPFYEKLLPVKLNNKWGYIDEYNNTVIPFMYDEAENFFQGIALVCLNNKWGIIDTNNEIKLSINYQLITTNSYNLRYFDLGKYENDEIYSAEIKYSEFVGQKDAVATKSKILLNGKEIEIQGYEIENNNYFKLRDIAAAFRGTPAQFNTFYDGNVHFVRNEPYEYGYTEQITSDEPKKATLSTSRIFLDGLEQDFCNFTSYKIDDNNYVKLRELKEFLDIEVTYDVSTDTIIIDIPLDKKSFL